MMEAIGKSRKVERSDEEPDTESDDFLCPAFLCFISTDSESEAR